MGRIKSEGRSVYAICPFYRRDTAQSLHCEGLTEQASIVQYFAASDSCTEFMRGFCCSARWEQCPISEAIVRAKYDV